MKEVEADGYKFSFEEALEAYVFDEKDPTKPTFHGAPMKGVDVVAEFEEAYIYVEIKDYDDCGEFNPALDGTEEEKEQRKAHLNWLKNYLKYKYRDSYLYRHAEQKVDKPVHYICLINFENALNSKIRKVLRQELPVDKKPRRWVQPIVSSCQVVNFDKWNENFPKWPVTRLGAAVL